MRKEGREARRCEGRGERRGVKEGEKKRRCKGRGERRGVKGGEEEEEMLREKRTRGGEKGDTGASGEAGDQVQFKTSIIYPYRRPRGTGNFPPTSSGAADGPIQLRSPVEEDRSSWLQK